MNKLLNFKKIIKNKKIVSTSSKSHRYTGRTYADEKELSRFGKRSGIVKSFLSF